MTVRYYSSVASEKTLTGTITSGQTTMVVSNTIGLPGLVPYTLAVDYETATEELVEVTNVAGTTLTITRAIDGTSASSHTAGARVRHVTSARDFTDSRTHENADDGIHGLAPGEEIVGTDKVQTLSNKTVVDLQGTLLNPDVNLTGTNVTTFSRSPAGADTVQAIQLMNGAEETAGLFNNGHLKVRNPVALDTAVTTRRMSTTMSNGTTERFYIEASGQVNSLPRSGTAAVNGGFKVIDPGDDVARKLFQARNSADTIDKFIVTSGGGVSITTSDNSTIGFRLKAPPVPATNWFQIVDTSDVVVVNVESSGEFNATRRIDVSNETLPAAVVLHVQGNATQTASLQVWANGAGTTVGRVRADGSGDFAAEVTTTGVITAATGWSTSSSIAIKKAGIVTINLALLRTGAPITASANGNLAGDPPIGTLAAAFRPHSSFGAPKFTILFMSDSDDGSGGCSMFPSTGDMTIDNFSPNATITTGSTIHLTLTYPVDFV